MMAMNDSFLKKKMNEDVDINFANINSGEKNTDSFIEDYMFIKGFTKENMFHDTRLSLKILRIMNLKTEEKLENKIYDTDMIAIALKRAIILILHGIKDDTTLAASLLIDMDDSIVEEIEGMISDEVVEMIKCFKDNAPYKDSDPLDKYYLRYYQSIRECAELSLIKCCDLIVKLDHVTKVERFHFLKIAVECEDYGILLCEYCASMHHEYSSIFEIMRLEMQSMTKMIWAFVNL